MKLKDGFCTQNVADGQIMVPIGEADTNFAGIVRSNETAAFVVECLKVETTEEEILQKLKDTYDAPEEKMRSDLRMVLDKLNSISALSK